MITPKMNILPYRLTASLTRFIISMLSTHLKDGIRPPRTGHTRPLLNVVFLCSPKTQALNRLVSSVMVGCIEQPLKRLAGSCIGRSNLIHSTAQQLDPVSGGFPFFTGCHHVTR
jgi:hypothetical protein